MVEGSNYNIFYRRDKIHQLIASNEIRQATLLLLDFARDFSRDKNFETEALIVCSNSAEYEKEKRQRIQELAELNRLKKIIIQTVCDILNEIINSQREAA
ncbi:MAG: hypothetical protein WKF97_00660 [Chitinophagaceae bacterium]